MIGTSGTGNTPVEDHDVGREHADGLEPGDAVGRFVDVLHAQIDQQVAHDLAHELVVVDDQNLDRVDELFELVRQKRSHDAPTTRRPPDAAF